MITGDGWSFSGTSSLQVLWSTAVISIFSYSHFSAHKAIVFALIVKNTDANKKKEVHCSRGKYANANGLNHGVKWTEHTFTNTADCCTAKSAATVIVRQL